MRATCGAFVGYGERGAFGAGWDGEEKAVGSAVCSGVSGVAGQGGAQAGGKGTVVYIKYGNPSHFGPRSGVNKYQNPSHLSSAGCARCVYKAG